MYGARRVKLLSFFHHTSNSRFNNSLCYSKMILQESMRNEYTKKVSEFGKLYIKTELRQSAFICLKQPKSKQPPK